MVIVDVWMQHPNRRLHGPDLRLVAPLGKAGCRGRVPLGDARRHGRGGVGRATGRLVGAQGPLITNDEVAGLVASTRSVRRRRLGRSPARWRPCASCGAACASSASGPAHRAVAVGPAARRPPLLPALRRVRRAGIPFCLQVGHTGPLRPSEPGRPIPYLDRVALDFPELTIVGGHIGYPWTDEMISLATKYPNVYIDTSAYKARRYPARARRVHARPRPAEGAVRLELPGLAPADCLQDLPSLQLDDQATDLFLHGNAERVFGLTGPPAPA